MSRTRKENRFLRLLVLGMFASLFSFSTAPRLFAETEVVTVGVYENEPKVFTSEAGRPAGIFIDIIEHIAGLEGWDLRYRTVTWAEGLDRVSAGEIDLMPDVAYTAARDELFDFHTEPVLSDWFQVYARTDSDIKSIVDLEGKRVFVLERSVQQETFGQLIGEFGLNVTVIPLPDYETIFEQVADGNGDAAVTNRFFGTVHAEEHGLKDTAIVFNPTKLFFATMEDNNAAILQTIDRRLVSMKRDRQSVYYRSLERWTTETVPLTLPGWIKIAGLVAGVALLTSLAAAVVLKRRVNTRTRELWKLNRRMEAIIEERTAELEEATEKAQSADLLKSAFLATMSHELRTPLNSIIGFTGILLKGLTGPLNPEQEKQLRMVRRSSRHLLLLINDVLDISKIEADQLALSYETFLLRSSIQKMIDIVAPMAEKKGLEILTDISDETGDVTTDSRRLEQIIINLLNNAVKFTETGYVRITCRPDGIEKARRYCPAAVLLDIQLPEMDGYAVAKELKKHPELETIPIIAVTSYAMAGDREKIMAAGADGYIEKPIDPDTFVDEIIRYIHGDW